MEQPFDDGKSGEADARRQQLAEEVIRARQAMNECRVPAEWTAGEPRPSAVGEGGKQVQEKQAAPPVPVLLLPPYRGFPVHIKLIEHELDPKVKELMAADNAGGTVDGCRVKVVEGM